jgi:hypothetical protein
MPRDAGPGEPCTGGETDVCDTPCGTVGLRVCTGGTFGPCAPPAEDCNGADDDCDGEVDEVTERACSSECGGGSERCESGSWTGCTPVMPREEECDGTDNDCDSMIDESLTRPCTTVCGAGTESCVGGTWAGCTGPRPAPETCDGTDEDCDGSVDESLTRPCSTACGSGVETCASGTWMGCTAPPVGTETCDGTDEDCDGTTDEGFRARQQATTYASLDGFRAGCSSERIGVTCDAAIHEWCRAERPCWTSGFGPVENSGGMADVTCVVADLRTISYAVARTHHPACDGSGGPLGPGCRAAYDRYCRSEGYGGGFGPVGGSVMVACVPRAHTARTSTTYSVLRTHHPMCDGTTEVLGPSCNAAIHRFCRSAGHESGFGPVEYLGDDATVVCVDR